MDNRIGFRSASETQWPALSISGREYTRPCTTVGLDGGYFVVIDIFPVADWQEQIDKLRNQGKGMDNESKRVGKKDNSV